MGVRTPNAPPTTSIGIDGSSRGWRVMRVFLQQVDEGPEDVAAAIRLELEQPGSMLTYEDRNPSTYTVR